MKSVNKTNENPKCDEKECMTCQNGKQPEGKCRKNDIVYKISCEECETKKKRANYYGDTHFNAFTRGKQHLEKYRSKNAKTQENSALRRHAKEVHNDKKVKFNMSIVKSFKEDPLARQIFESVQIVESKEKDDYPLNSKNEFNQALIVTAKFTRGVHN